MNKQVLSRKFNGSLDSKVTDEQLKDFQFDPNPELAAQQLHLIKRTRANFDKAHLKAYLKGNERFTFGFTVNKAGVKVPNYFEVQQEYFYI